MRDPVDDARRTVSRLVMLVRAGDVGTVAGSLELLTFSGSQHRERLGQILHTVIDVTASMVQARAEHMGVSGTFAADLRRADESLVEIDSIHPPMRATIRALLAAVNESPDDAADQVELVLAGGYEAWRDSMLLALRWAIMALDWCERHEVATPAWLGQPRAA